MARGLHRIQDDVKTRLDIDHQITDCVSRPDRYTIDELLELNMKLFLGYSQLLINSIKGNLKKLKLVSTREYWLSLNGYIKIFRQLEANPKIDDIQIEATEELYNNLVVEKEKLYAAKSDFEMLKKKVFLKYLLSIVVAVSTGYFGIIKFVLNSPIDSTVVIVYGIVLYVSYWFLKKYFGLD